MTESLSDLIEEAAPQVVQGDNTRSGSRMASAAGVAALGVAQVAGAIAQRVSTTPSLGQCLLELGREYMTWQDRNAIVDDIQGLAGEVDYHPPSREFIDGALRNHEASQQLEADPIWFQVESLLLERDFYWVTPHPFLSETYVTLVPVEGGWVTSICPMSNFKEPS